MNLHKIHNSFNAPYRIMKQLFNASFIAVAILLGNGCSSKLAPYETSVDQIFKLNMGMSQDQVTTVLAVRPHQFYFDGTSGCKVVEYRYRRKYYLGG
jgi:hypothetical protein